VTTLRWYQTVALVAVAAAVGFVAGSKLAPGRAPAAGPAEAITPASGDPEEELCCAPPPSSARNIGTPPGVPTGSGLPCLVEFGSDECESCQLMEDVLHEVADKLAGKLDVVAIDTDLYPEEATRWRLRLIPTQILLDPGGKELWRHEDHLPAQDLLAGLAEAGVELGEATKTD
jgi:thioredoxin 1